MKAISRRADFAVVGGGLAGLCAAVAAAREGIDTVLIHDRPVPGGNASSEIRMWICGAHGENRRETGIVEELLLENLHRNPEGNYSIWDSVLYGLARREKHLTVFLNTSCQEVEMAGSRIRAVRGYQSVSQTRVRVEAEYFADCSGDSVLAPLAGAEVRYGREARSEFGESIAPVSADRRTMGMSCLLQARETLEPHDFIAPEWANRYENGDAFRLRGPELAGLQNFWWIELGGDGDALHDVDANRDELLKIAFGVWDYLKNHPDNRARYRNWELEWIGFLPGKRESFRYVGDVIVTQHDVASGGRFPDRIAYGGWTMDDHHPEGFRYPGEPNVFHPAPSPFGLPYRAIYSKNIENLFMAGRNISVTHAALSASRVMATCALLGQAAGSAAALAKQHGCTPREVGRLHLAELQNRLMRDDVWLPGFRYDAPEVTKRAELMATGRNDPAGLRLGQNRVTDEGGDESWHASPGDAAEYRWPSPVKLTECRIVFDSDLNRQRKNIVALRFLALPRYRLPGTLVKKFRLEYRDAAGQWRRFGEFDGNYRRLVRLSMALTTDAVRLTVLETWGEPEVKVFAWTFSGEAGASRQALIPE